MRELRILEEAVKMFIENGHKKHRIIRVKTVARAFKLTTEQTKEILSTLRANKKANSWQDAIRNFSFFK